ncbi:MAG: FtsX-like permease family protein [Bacteroidaceae bacterium]|nr:FtsX-like permease family protein [Bacteroidaceae bacterium]
MNLSFYIAKRYLFSKKSHQVINIISGVAIAGVALATIAMVCTLSVFNGFKEMVAQQFTALDPDIKITAERGKSFTADSLLRTNLRALPCVAVASIAVEDKAMAQYQGRQVMITLKGVEEDFKELTNIEDALIGNGGFTLRDSINSYAVPGVGVITTLNCGIYHVAPLEIYAPKRRGKVSMSNPASNFKKRFLHPSGGAFIVNQPQYDDHYILTSAQFAREVLGRSANEATSIEIKLADGYSASRAKQDIKSVIGDGFIIEDRYEQQKDVFKVMKIEKFISYIFLSFILLIACFNIIGSLSMLIIEKRENMETLRSLGATDNIITNIFVFEGSVISMIGAIGGIVIGLGACLLQQEYGLLTLGNGMGDFVVDSYPVKVEAADIIAIFGTVAIVGLVAVWLPVKFLTKKFIRR